MALVGGDGGDLQALADLTVLVPSRNTQHIQEVHEVIVHVLCELVEGRLVAAGWFERDRRVDVGDDAVPATVTATEGRPAREDRTTSGSRA